MAKERLRDKFVTWCDDHVVEIGMGTTFVLGGVAGFFLGKDAGRLLAYDEVGETLPEIMWNSARIGSAATLYAIDQKIPEAYEAVKNYESEHLEELTKFTSDKVKELLFK